MQVLFQRRLRLQRCVITQTIVIGVRAPTLLKLLMLEPPHVNQLLEVTTDGLLIAASGLLI